MADSEKPLKSRIILIDKDMSMTSKSDIYGRFHESSFNRILSEILLQKPAVFNYATQRVFDNNKTCTPVAVNPILDSMGVTKCTIVEKIPVIGSEDPNLGVDYCMQVKELKVDFHPGNQFQLPPELENLALQQIALKGTVYAGIACDSLRLGRTLPGSVADIKKPGSKKKDFEGLTFYPFDTMLMNCFNVSLYVRAIFVNENAALRLKLCGIELQDIAPAGLESSIECYIKQVLDSVIFPKIKIPLEDLVFSVDEYFMITAAPITPTLQYNPEVSNDYLSVYLNII